MANTIRNDESAPLIHLKQVFLKMEISLPVEIKSADTGGVVIHHISESDLNSSAKLLFEAINLFSKLHKTGLIERFDSFDWVGPSNSYVSGSLRDKTSQFQIQDKELCIKAFDLLTSRFMLDYEFIAFVENDFKTQEQLNFEEQIKLSRESTSKQIEQSEAHFSRQIEASEKRFEKRFTLQRWAIWIAVVTLVLNLGFQVIKWGYELCSQ